MELSLAKCESIVNTLPTGFYTGRRIEIELDKEEQTSFYDMMSDKIVVSYPIIAHRMSQVKEGTCDEEEAVRSMVYHEVSHAILTPKDLRNDGYTNIMEDERIETVLRNYFHGVNFRKQLYDIHGGHAPKASDTQTAFFNAVRFGLGTPEVQKEVNRILKKYSKMNRNTDYYTSESAGVCDYIHDIRELRRLIGEEFESNPDSFQEPESSGEAKDMDKVKGKEKGEKGEGEGEEKSSGSGKENSSNEEEEENNGQESQPYKGEPHESNLKPEEIKRMVGACLSNNDPNLEEEQIQQLNDFQKTAEMIIGNFNKKNKGGSGINAYSGVFNPRSVVRKDYRFFDRAMTTQGNNKFGTCHLNLIIDCSGSFHYNVPITNGILKVLSEIERKNRNFSMDVAFINERFRICESVRDRKMTASGGNAIPKNMKEILLKMQKPQTCNYNIVLFDGDAICQDCEEGESNKRFSAFDMKQTTLITDPDNEKYMNPPFSSTKVVVTKKYTDELINHITRALTIAFG